MTPTEGRYEAHRWQYCWAWLQRQDRWGLWDSVAGVPSAKIFVPLNGLGRQWSSARWALGQQHRMDSAGMAHRRGGVAIELSPSDAERYGALLRDEHVESFNRPELPDLVRPDALREPPPNGQPHETPTDTMRPETSNGKPRSRKLGVILEEDVVAAIRRYSTQHQLLVKQVLDQAAREFFERHGWPPVLTAHGAALVTTSFTLVRSELDLVGETSPQPAPTAARRI